MTLTVRDQYWSGSELRQSEVFNKKQYWLRYKCLDYLTPQHATEEYANETTTGICTHISRDSQQDCGDIFAIFILFDIVSTYSLVVDE